jgi:hypothetical protein
MKSTKTFNNISEELKREIPKLKQGEVKTFIMLNGTPNPDPDSREAAKEPILYGKKQLKTNFRIWDKYQKDSKGEVVGGFVDCGAVERWNKDEPERYIMLVPGMEMGSRFQGKFSLTGGNQKDEELFEILYLSPEREGTPCPDEGVAPLFRLIDFKSEIKHSNSRFETLKKAIDIADEITEDKAREVMAALNQPTYQDKEVLMPKLKDLARTQPDQFIKTYESDETPVRALVRDAINKNVLDHDFASGKVSLGGVGITTMKTETSEAFLPNFAKWLMTAENGKSVLNNIKSQMEKKAEVTNEK